MIEQGAAPYGCKLVTKGEDPYLEIDGINATGVTLTVKEHSIGFHKKGDTFDCHVIKRAGGFSLDCNL